MKKIKIFSIIIAIGIGITGIQLNQKKCNAASVEELPKCGYTINKVKCSSLNEINTGGTVLSSNYLDNLVIVDNQYRKEGTIQTISDTQKTKITKELAMNISNDVSNKISVFDLTNAIGTSLSYKNNSTASAYYTRLYNVTTSTYIISNSTIKDFKTTSKKNEFSMESNLSDSYISDLCKVFDGGESFDSLFDTYGTHLCASVNYGGTFYLTMAVKTNKVLLNNNQIIAINSKLNSSIDNVLECRNNFNASVFSEYGFDSSSTYTEFKISYTGGDPFGAIDVNSFNTAYSNWANSIKNNPSVVSYGDDGLVPLWEFLPSRFSSLKERMIQAYKNYAAKHEVVKDDVFNGYSSSISTEYYTVNSGEQLITDNAIVNNNFYLSDVTGININLIKKYFSKITITIACYIHLKDDGYQNVGISKANSIPSSIDGCIKFTRYNHTEHHKKNEEAYYVTTFELSKEDIDDYMSICLIGSGKLSDDWYCRDLQVKVKLS